MTQIREEAYFTKGQVNVRGRTVRRGEAKKADYILSYKPNLPIAIVEAKDNNHSVGAGMQQALDYAEILDVPFAYSSNGDAFLEHDRTVKSGTVTREFPLDQFPTPEELWVRYCAAKGFNQQQAAIATQDYYDDGSGKSPRYYQRIAINRTVDAIARGEKRILLVMATGTGKTYTAFQIIWRLWKSAIRKRNVFGRYGAQARMVLEALLDKYSDSGVKSVESLDILKVDPLPTFGTPIEILKLFGGKPHYIAAVRDLETALYQEAA